MLCHRSGVKQTQKGEDPTIQESNQYIQGSQCTGTRIDDVKDPRGTTCNELEQNTWPPDHLGWSADHPSAAFFTCTNGINRPTEGSRINHRMVKGGKSDGRPTTRYSRPAPTFAPNRPTLSINTPSLVQAMNRPSELSCKVWS